MIIKELILSESLTEKIVEKTFSEYENDFRKIGEEIQDVIYDIYAEDDNAERYNDNIAKVYTVFLTALNRAYADLITRTNNISPDMVNATAELLACRALANDLNSGGCDLLGCNYTTEDHFVPEDNFDDFYRDSEKVFAMIKQKMIELIPEQDFVEALDSADKYGKIESDIFNNKYLKAEHMEYEEAKKALRNDAEYQEAQELCKYYRGYAELLLIKKSCEERLSEYNKLYSDNVGKRYDNAEKPASIDKVAVGVVLNEMMKEYLTFAECKDILHRACHSREIRDEKGTPFIKAMYVACLERGLHEVAEYIKETCQISAGNFRKATKLLRFKTNAEATLHDLNHLSGMFGEFHLVVPPVREFNHSVFNELQNIVGKVYYHKIIECFPVKTDFVYKGLADIEYSDWNDFKPYEKFRDELNEFLKQESMAECYWVSR